MGNKSKLTTPILQEKRTHMQNTKYICFELIRPYFFNCQKLSYDLTLTENHQKNIFEQEHMTYDHLTDNLYRVVITVSFTGQMLYLSLQKRSN